VTVTTPTVGEAFLEACAAHRGRRCLVGDGVELSYGELEERVRARAEAVASVAGEGERRIGIQAQNSIEYVVTYYGVVQAGRVPFLIDAQFGVHEMTEIWIACGVRTFLVDAAAADRFPLDARVRPLPGSTHAAISPGDPSPARPAPELHALTGTCRFTSGTTGMPKCLEFSHRSVIAAAANWAEATGLTAADRTLCVAAFTNGLAFNTSFLSTLLAGGELHPYRGLPMSSRILQMAREGRVTRLAAFPLVYRLLAEAEEARAGDLESLRMAISAAAVLPAEIRAAFERRYGARVVDYYGVAEAGPCTYERDPSWRAGLGTPLPGVSLRIAEEGERANEVLVRTESMATRYLNAPGLLEQNLDDEGFYRTGDTGYLREGRLFVTGRLETGRGAGPINIAGRKVDPTEIETAILGLEGVTDAVVFADGDAAGGGRLHAVVASGRALTRGDVVRACRERLAPYKVPSSITFVPRIPRSASGKVRFVELQELVRQGRGGSERQGRSR
jgi:acyl-CoA synthetase (AMP-forming)/AMP-acid ligase II